MAKRERVTNFTLEEEELLLLLVERHKDIVECKKTDHMNNRMKGTVWNSIENEFNATAGSTFRSGAVLSTKYKNIKKRCKTKFSQEKLAVKGTGGGPPLQVMFSEAENIAAKILGNRMTGFSSSYDDDAENNGAAVSRENVASIFVETIPATKQDQDEDSENVIIPEEYLEDLIDYDEIQLKSSDASNVEKRKCWGGQTTPLLRTKISSPLKGRSETKENLNSTKKRKQLQDNMSNWARGKSALNDLQQKFAVEDHELNKKHKIEGHNAKMEWEAKLNSLKEEEMNLRIQCLKEDLAIKKLQKMQLLRDE